MITSTYSTLATELKSTQERISNLVNVRSSVESSLIDQPVVRQKLSDVCTEEILVLTQVAEDWSKLLTQKIEEPIEAKLGFRTAEA